MPQSTRLPGLPQPGTPGITTIEDLITAVANYLIDQGFGLPNVPELIQAETDARSEDVTALQASIDLITTTLGSILADAQALDDRVTALETP